jgi:carboxyvinyl-carboxyphosphonate phosphorylmutase
MEEFASAGRGDNMSHTEQRKRLRAILKGSICLSPASVYDPLSARIAQSIGYELGLLAGSVASHTTLAAPDRAGLTLTEFADQARRIMRACSLSLIVDADTGYGNALNVMRTVQELEHAGVSAIAIEDLVLPTQFGQPEGGDELVSIEEMVGKLRAALAARHDPALVIAGRVAALSVEGTAGAVARSRAYAATGIDAIFVTKPERLDQIEAIHQAVESSAHRRPAARVFPARRPCRARRARSAAGPSAGRSRGEGAARNLRASFRRQRRRRPEIENRCARRNGTCGRRQQLQEMAARVSALMRSW